MLIGGDLGFFFSAVVVVVGWLFTRRKWRQASARTAEITRLMALASEEAARAEFEATSSYKTYASYLAPEPVAVESVGRQLQYHCEVCFRPTTTRCKQCKAVHYCSRNCQVVHWRQGHKDECHSLTTSQNIDAGVDSCIKEFEQDGSNQNAIEFEEMHTTEPVESSPETCMVPKPNFSEIGDNVDIETEVSNRKRVDLNVKASVHSLSDECSSSTISIEKSVASDNNLNDYNKDYGQITSEVKSTRSPISEQHSLTSHELDCAASSVSNKVQLVQINTDERSESSILSGSSAAYSEEYSASESSALSSDFWTGTVEPTRHRSNALDEFDDVNMSNSHISISPSASRINIHAEIYVSGMNKVSAGDPGLVTSTPKKSIAPLSQVSEDGLDSREPSLGCKLPDPYGDSNTSTKCSSTKGSNLSSFSSRHGGISEGHVPSTLIDVSSLQSVVPIKLDDESDRTHVILDTLTCQRNNSFGLGSTESHLSSNQVLKSVRNDCTCDNGVCSLESSSNVKSATSGTNLSMKRNAGQLRASDFISHGSLSAGSGIMRRYEGSFPYELFVKLYNWNNVELSPCGLINCGNSCYANAVLQCLAFTPPLAAYCLQGLHAKTCRKREWCFTCEFEDLVKKAKEGNNPVSPARIMSQMQCMGSHLGNGREEDAHEFLRYAIEAMQSVCLKETKVDVPSSLVEETTLLGLTFGGYLQSKIECMRCGGKSKQNDRIMDLTAEIEGNIGSLEDALLQFTNSEILDGENKYHCGRCKSYEKAKKKLRVLEAPNVLVIALKRFQTGKFGKLNKVIKFPEILNLAPYMSGTSDKSPIYQLYGVVVHLDVMNAVFSGHYVCYIKNKQGRWFKADDSVVQEVELENVLSNDAYILFYARCSPRAPRVIRSSMGPRKAKDPSCNVKPHPWDSSMGGRTSSNGYFGRTHPTEESSSEYSSSYFSEGGSHSTESTYRESVSTTDDNFDRILGDSLRHFDFDCCSDTESTSSCSVNMSPKMQQVRDGFQVRGSSKDHLLGFKSRGTFSCSRVGNCSCSSSNTRLGSNVRDVYL